MKRTRTIHDIIKAEMPEFADAVATLSEPEINHRLAELAKNAMEVSKAKEDDTDLLLAKLAVTDLSAPHREAKRAVSLRSEYLVTLLKERKGET